MPPCREPEAPAVPQEHAHDEDCDDGRHRPDEVPADDVGDVVDVGRDACGAHGGREDEQARREATPPRQQGGRDRRRERRVVRREPVVRGVRDERCLTVDDEGARVRPEVRPDLDADEGEDDRQDSDAGEGQLLGAGDLQPDERGGERDEEDGIRGDGDDE